MNRHMDYQMNEKMIEEMSMSGFQKMQEKRGMAGRLDYRTSENMTEEMSMSGLHRMRGKQAEVPEVEEKNKGKHEESAKGEIERNVQEHINVAMELSDHHDVLTEMQERLVTITQRFCFNPYGIRCYDLCG